MMVRSERWVNPVRRPTQKIRSPASADEELREGEGPTRRLERSFQAPLDPLRLAASRQSRRKLPHRHHSIRTGQSAPELLISLREFLCRTDGFAGYAPAASDWPLPWVC